MKLKPYLDIFRLVWPLVLGMLNNAVLQFVDGVFLARESMESLDASLPASMLALVVMGFFQSMTALGGIFGAFFAGIMYKTDPMSPFALALAAVTIAAALALIYAARYKKGK